jgi:hypothetical protein
MLRRLARLIRPIARQGVALLALAGFLAGTVGVPLPARIAWKDGSQPFPCLSRQCGCQNAAQCWRGCCCFTNKQKVAWAKEHKVELPQFVLTAGKRETRRELCQSAQVGRSATGTCCTKKSVEEPASELAPVVVQFVLAIEARQCHGQAEQWLSLGAVVPLPQAVDLAIARPCCGKLCVADAHFTSLTLSPAAPPPRGLVVS